MAAVIMRRCAAKMPLMLRDASPIRAIQTSRREELRETILWVIGRSSKSTRAASPCYGLKAIARGKHPRNAGAYGCAKDTATRVPTAPAGELKEKKSQRAAEHPLLVVGCRIGETLRCDNVPRPCAPI